MSHQEQKGYPVGQQYPQGDAPPPYSTTASGIPPGYPPAPQPYVSGYAPGAPGAPPPGYPGAPQMGYTPGAPIGHQPMGMGQPTVLVQQFRDTPVRTTCPSCRVEIVTATEHKVGGMTYLCCGILCMSCLWWGPCMIPFCVDSAKDVDHTCPNCKTRVGHYNKLG